MHMTEQELNAIVESKLEEQLAARLQADRNRIREEVISALRREETRKWYDRINAKHPVEDRYGGLGPEGHAARLKAMSAAAAKANAEMDAANARVVSGSLLEQRSRADSAGGSAGFEVRPGRARS
jgi:hypothetical protein